MIKEALQYIVGLKEPVIKEFYDDFYTDKDMKVIKRHIPRAERLCISTLTGLIDYIRADVDKMSERMVIEVVSPVRVRLLSQLDCERNRETLIEADIGQWLPKLPFDKFWNQEDFCIILQSAFVESNDRDLLLKFAGTVENGTIAQYSDDGVTQKATIRTGLASKGEALVPNPVKLKPYRTFLEIEQPESEFIFRMKDNSNGVSCALFAADGGAWKLEAMQRVKAYLEGALEEYPQFTIIA